MFGADHHQKETMPSKFVRSSPQRASVGMLKQPKLPGSERFRFNRSTEDLSTPFARIGRASTVLRRRPTSPPPPVPTSAPSGYDPHHHRRPRAASPATSPGVYYFRHQGSSVGGGTDGGGGPRRKPVIPISKHTSRVLNNTNVELSADAIEFIKNETSRINNICKTYIVPTDSTAATSATSDDCSDSGASSLSSNSSARSSGCSDRNGRFWLPGMVTADQRPNDSAWPPSQTVAIRGGNSAVPPIASRGASVPVLGTFLPRSSAIVDGSVADDAFPSSSTNGQAFDYHNQSWMRIRRKRSGSSGSPSPTQSVCSSDSDNPWVLRVHCNK